MFGKKKPKAQSITIPEQFAQIPPSRSIAEDLDEVEQESEPEPVKQPVKTETKPVINPRVVEIDSKPVEDFELITNAMLLSDGTYQYTVITNRKLAIGLQEN